MPSAVPSAPAWPVLSSIPVLLRIDARRFASWLMLAAAAAVFPCLASAGAAPGSPAPIAALLAGAVLVVAAVGDLPLEACRQPRASPWLAGAWLCERAAWPVAGMVSAAAAWSAAAQPCLTVLSASLLGAVAAGATLHLLRRGGASAADAASLTIAMAAAAAWAGWPAAGVAAGVQNIAVAAGAWGAIGLVVRAVDRGWGSGWEWLPDGERPPRRLRKLLTAAAMAAALYGMVSWLFLDPSRAALFPVMAAAAYAALAIPEATFGDGVSDTVAWRRLHRSAAGPVSRRGRLRPGFRRSALIAAVSNAAILGWPPLVAAALSAGRGDAVGDTVGAVIVLALAATGLILIALGGDMLRATPDSMHAAAIAAAAAAAIVAAMMGEALRGDQANRPACPDCLLPAAANRPCKGNGRMVTLRKSRVPATLPLHRQREELG